MKSKPKNLVSRRHLLQGLSASVALSPLVGSSAALAKPGGCFLMAGHCLTALELKGIGRRDLYFSTLSYASFNNVLDYSDFVISSILTKSMTTLSWETIQCWAANAPDLGVVRAKGKIRGRSDQTSTVVFLSESGADLFPADTINLNYFDFEFPALDLRLFNKEPMELRGLSEQITPQYVSNDPRVVANPEGLPSSIEEAFNRPGGFFEPHGKHTMQTPITLYDADNPNEEMGTILSAEVTLVPHYGVEVSLDDYEVDGAFITTRWRIQNLLDVAKEVYFSVSDVGNVRTVSETEGLLVLDKDPVFIDSQAVLIDPEIELSLLDCIFCGVTNTIERDIELIAGFGMVDGDGLLKQK
ncbi:hypothetical protein [Roseibium album]|uniref:hypothetical protein n=1 Tax=Roseibium album TaxID=311410 RepID=UPI003BB045A3